MILSHSVLKMPMSVFNSNEYQSIIGLVDEMLKGTDFIGTPFESETFQFLGALHKHCTGCLQGLQRANEYP